MVLVMVVLLLMPPLRMCLLRSMLPSASPTIMRRISMAPSGLVAGSSTRGAYAGVTSLSRVWFHPHTETTKTAVAAKALPKVDFKVMDGIRLLRRQIRGTTLASDPGF